MPKVKRSSRLTLFQLIDWNRLADFVGWPFADEISDYGTVLTPAAEVVQKRFAAHRSKLLAAWATHPLNQFKRPATTGLFVRECSREEFGVKGRNAVEVVAACAAMHPDRFMLWPPCPACGGQGTQPPNAKNNHHHVCDECRGDKLDRSADFVVKPVAPVITATRTTPAAVGDEL